MYICLHYHTIWECVLLHVLVGRNSQRKSSCDEILKISGFNVTNQHNWVIRDTHGDHMAYRESDICIHCDSITPLGYVEMKGQDRAEVMLLKACKVNTKCKWQSGKVSSTEMGV